MTIETLKENKKSESGEIKRNEYRRMGTYDFVRRDIERFFAHPVDF